MVQCARYCLKVCLIFVTPFDVDIIVIPHFKDEDIEAEKIKLYKSYTLDTHALKIQDLDLN